MQIELNKIVLQDSPLNPQQIEKLLKATPKGVTKILPGANSFEYVPHYYMIKQLNHIFGWKWDFQVVREILPTPPSKQVNVLGRLTVWTTTNSDCIVKEQYGSSSNAKDPFKSAASDALKKCASMLGVCIDVYSRVESKEIKVIASGPAPDSHLMPTECELVAQFVNENIDTQEQYEEFIKSPAYQKYKFSPLLIKSLQNARAKIQM